MRKILYLLSVIIFSFSGITAVYAVSQKEAEELKTSINQYMAAVKRSYDSSPNASLEFIGDLSVTPKSNYYEVVLPKISFGISNPNNPADEFYMILDPIIANISKIDEESWSASFAVPSPITAKDGNDRETMKIRIGSQRASMVFVPKFLTATKYNISYKDLVIEDLIETDLKINIAEISSYLNLTKQANEFWSGPFDFKIKDISLKAKDLDLAIKNVLIKGMYEELDMVSMAALSKQALNMDPATITAEEQAEFVNNSFKAMAKSTGGMNIDMSLNEVNGRYFDKKGDINRDFSIGKIGVSFSGKSLRTDMAQFGFTFDLKDTKLPKVENQNNIIDAVIPHNMEIDMLVKNIPLQSLFSYLADINTGSANSNNIGNDAVQKLVDAGVKLVINKNNMEARDIGFAVHGDVTANPNAILKMIADFTIKIRNLDEMIAKYSAPGTLPPEFQAIIPMATMLQMVGTQEVNTKGEKIRSYRIELTPEGKMLLNGADMSSIMGGGAMMQQNQMQPPVASPLE